MRNNKIGNVAIGKDGVGAHKFNLSHDVNTTMEFGDVEPLFIHEMMANSSMRVKAENLTRLAPLVAPCFGRMKYHNYNLFVKKKDLFPFYDEFQAQKSVANATSFANVVTSVPTEIPHIAANKLFSLCFIGADYQYASATGSAGFATNGPFGSALPWVYRKHQMGGRWAETIYSGSSKAATPFISNLTYNYNICWFIGRYANNSGSTARDKANVPVPAGNTHFVTNTDTPADPTPLVTMDNADYTFYGHSGPYDSKTWATATTVFSHSFRFSNYGRRIAKILRVCGYPMDAECSKEVSILPLLAYYRAYYELFGVQLYSNWESTPAYSLIQSFRYNHSDAGLTSDLNQQYYDYQSRLWAFFRDLANCWVSDEQDFVSSATKVQSGFGLLAPQSIHSINDFLEHGARRLKTVFGATGDQIDTSTVDGLNSGRGDSTAVTGHNQFPWALSNKNPGQIWITKTEHTELDAKLLRKAYKLVNRQTVLGQRIAATLNAMGQEHYDEDVPCPFIGHVSIPLNVSDVTSLADTTASGGKSLGEFGGKAVGYNAGKSFKWKTNVDGYWVSFSAIIPEAGYCQGVDSTLFNITKYSTYQPEFERSGMVPILKMQVAGQPAGSVQLQSGNRYHGSSGNLSPLEAVHGYLPRYTEYKIARNVVSGDFARNSTADTYAPYHLDRLIPIGRRNFGLGSNGAIATPSDNCVSAESVPMAGTSWRYSSRYPWLSNFTRIFANMGLVRPASDHLNAGAFAFPADPLSGDTTGYNYDILTQNDDNFICHNVLLVDYTAPMLPIGDSFETFDEEKGANGGVSKA